MSIRWYSVVVDCRDVAAQSRWWAEALGWRIIYEAGAEVVVVPPHAIDPAGLSKLQRGGQQDIGIDTQDEKSRAFCEREGMTVVGVVADTKSGTVAPWDRKNLKPWVTEPEKMARYDAVVAYKTDRWSRGTQEDSPGSSSGRRSTASG